MSDYINIHQLLGIKMGRKKQIKQKIEKKTHIQITNHPPRENRN